MNNIFHKLPIKFQGSSLFAFLMGMTVILLGYFINSLGLRPLDFLRTHKPVVKESMSTQDKIQQKIQKSPKNTFNLKKEKTLIAKAHASAPIDAGSYVVVDADTGEVLSSSGSDQVSAIASITKVMSAVVTLDLVTPDTIFTITPRASTQIPTKIGVVAGQKMTVEELLNASLLTSANDATQALADGVDALYGRGAFVAAMNEKARYLGLSNSYFTNPQGFDRGGNRSTAEEVAILSSYALSHYPLIAEIAKKDYEFLPEDQNHKQFDLNNWNGLLGVYPGASGLKIGNTGRAGYTTVVSATREGKTLIAVILGTSGVKERDTAAATALDMGFESKGIKPAEITDEMLSQKYASWKYWN